MRPGMPSGRAHPSVGRSCERLRRAAGALAAEGGRRTGDTRQDCSRDGAGGGRRRAGAAGDRGQLRHRRRPVRAGHGACRDGRARRRRHPDQRRGSAGHRGSGGHRRLRRLGVLRANQRQGTRDRHHPASGCRPHATWPPCSGSTATPSCEPCGCSATKDCWNSGTARQHGYRRDELIQITESLP
jgi:hypothetical protein